MISGKSAKTRHSVRSFQKVDMSIIHDIQTPTGQLDKIDRILLARIQFPEPQPPDYFHSLGTSSQDKAISSHEFLFPKKYANPSHTELVVIELALLRMDYWHRKTHSPTDHKGSIRWLAGYLDTTEQVCGIVPGIETLHQFHMLKDCAAFEAHKEAVKRGLLPLRLPSGKLLGFNRKPRNPPPPPLYPHCSQCGERAKPIRGRVKQDEFRANSFPTSCGKCGGNMIELETSQPLMLSH